ncbi:PAS domain-containing protein [Hymenobacter terricola]|uniref:PAS domain-containing protein n=1 Tax=Hymenobacter terricola TaxID=2819236 RepID=UPI001B30FDB3|nr:PAS domain-containing protein [Hymenobacter terricola]
MTTATLIAPSAINYPAALAAAEQHIQKLTAALARAREVEQMVEHLSDRLLEGLLLLDATGIIVLANRRFFSLLGLPDEPAVWHGKSVRCLAAKVQPLVAAPAELVRWAERELPWRQQEQQELVTLHQGAVLACEMMPPAAEAGPAGTWLLALRDVSEQQHLRAALKSVSCIPEEDPSPIVRIGANGQQLYANPAARRVGRHLTRAEQVRLQKQLRCAAAAALAQAAPHQLEVALREQVYSVAVMPFPREGYVNLYFADISEREAVRQQLAEQQQFTQQVLDTIPALIFVRDTKQQFVFQNPAMQGLMAGSGMARPDAVAPDSVLARELAEYAAVDVQVLATGQEIATEEAHTLLDGTIRWFYTVKGPLHRPDGTVHVLGVSTDITALKQSRQTLERSEKQYRDLMTYSQAFIFTHDLQGRVLTVNPAVTALLNRPVEELLGQSMAINLPPEDIPAFEQYLQLMSTAREATGVQRMSPHGSPRLHYLQYRSFRVEEPNQVPYIIVHTHDITERVLAGKELKRAKQAAEAAVRARENFLANMSHEIRTPMNGVLGVANLLAKTPLTVEQQELLRIIRVSGQHLLAVLNDVLDMAKIASGKLELNLESFNLCDSVAQALQPLALQALEKGLHFEGTPLSATCPFPLVQADAHRINQIMLNLVSNAVKFTPAGGRVKVKGELLAQTADTLTVRFRVTDTGLGMAPEVQARIFESFTQAYADTARRFGGTGLGLSISRALVEQMGGELTVASALGVGSTFAFSLTLARAVAPAVESVAEAFDTGVLAGVRVLLVEDNDINRFVARRTMQEWGIVVTEAVDGASGVARFAQQPFDLVLMDIQMPGMSGLDAMALIRAHAEPARAGVPILALTANAFHADHERYRAAGMNDCLAKPFEEAELYDKLRKLLRY